MARSRRPREERLRQNLSLQETFGGVGPGTPPPRVHGKDGGIIHGGRPEAVMPLFQPPRPFGAPDTPVLADNVVKSRYGLVIRWVGKGIRSLRRHAFRGEAGLG